MDDEHGFFDVDEPPDDRVVAVPGGDVILLAWDLSAYSQSEQAGDEVLQALGVDPAQVHRPPLLLHFGEDGVLRPPRDHNGANEPERRQ